MPFPVDALPHWQRRMVEDLARATQTDIGMAAMFSLGVLSATVSRRFALRTPRGPNHLNLWVIVVAESGEGKSSVLTPLIEPLELIQRAVRSSSRELLTPIVNPPREPPTLLERILADDDDDSAPLPNVDPTQVLHLMQIEQQRRYPGVPLNFLTRDATPQATADMLSSQYMAVLQASSEGGFTTWISASPSRATGDLAALNLAWDGESQPAPSRISRPTRPIDRACLSMVFAPQPASFQAATRGRIGRLLRETGYLARCLYFFPRSSIGSRRAPFEARSRDVTDTYRAYVWSLLAVGVSATEEVKLLEFSSRAECVYNDFFNELEPRLAAGGDLRHASAWIERLRQNTLRIAGVLHLAEHVERALNLPVDEHRVANAIRIARALLPHGVRGFSAEDVVQGTTSGRTVESRALEAARRRFPVDTFSARQIHRGMQSTHSSQEVAAELELAVEQGSLERVDDDRHPRYRVLRAPVTGDSDDDT